MDRVNRLIAVLSLPLLVALSGAAYALGLGEARVNSFLNQQLDISIRLLEVRDEDLETLTVRPAQSADYERLGVMSDALALGLRAELDRSTTPPSVRIRSDRIASDPVLQILVDARWANGRVLREYTLFLDPPTVDVAPPAPAVTRVEPEARPAEPVPGPAEPPPRRVPPAPAPAREIGDTYGPVASGETLWGIARDWRPDPSLTMNQVMLAILERNPHAFRDGNVNHLLRGARLEMPTIEEVARTGASEATARVQIQNEAFRTGRRVEEIPVVADAAIAPAEPLARTEPPDPAPETEHRLELVPPRDDDPAGTAGEAELSQLQEELARMEEELFATRMEAEELHSRLAEIEAYLVAEGERLGLPDADLARLQQSLREARLARLEMETEPGLDLDAADRVQALMAQLRGEAADTEPPPVDPGVAAEPPAPAAETLQATPVGQQPTGLRGLLGQPLVLGLIALLVLLVVVLVAWRLLRGRQASYSGGASSESFRSTGPDALQRARERVRKSPEELGGHLALLRILADRDDPKAFGAALEDMFSYVNSGQERFWRDALVLASRLVPDHPLVSGSRDAVEPPGPEAAAPSSVEGQTDDKTRDILRILERDRRESGLDPEDDDAQWQPEEEEGPDLGLPTETGEESGAEDTRREIGDTGQSDPSSGRIWGLGDDSEEPPPMDLDLDMSDLPDPDRRDETRASEDRVEEFLRSQGMDEEVEPASDDSRSAPADEPETEPGAGEPAGRRRDELGGDGPKDSDEADELGLEWTSEAAEAGEEVVEGADEDSGIFSLGEDDVEVKLDLARAYISMEDVDAARTMLEEVLKEGNTEQQEQARKLLDGL